MKSNQLLCSLFNPFSLIVCFWVTAQDGEIQAARLNPAEAKDSYFSAGSHCCFAVSRSRISFFAGSPRSHTEPSSQNSPITAPSLFQSRQKRWVDRPSLQTNSNLHIEVLSRRFWWLADRTFVVNLLHVKTIARAATLFLSAQLLHAGRHPDLIVKEILAIWATRPRHVTRRGPAIFPS
jgi:hypothetical protein